jgi:hypothetical protein
MNLWNAMLNISILTEYFYSLIFLTTGIVLNLICFLVFTRKRMNTKTSIGFLHSVLCLLNIFALSLKICTSILDYYKIDVTMGSPLICVCLNVALSMSIHMPSFQLVIISLDMFLSVHSFKKAITKRFHLTVMLITFLLLLITKSPYFFFVINIREDQINLLNSTHNLTYIDAGDNFIYGCNTSSNVIDFIADLLNIVLRAYIPFVIIFILNVLIIKKIVNSKKKIVENGSCYSSKSTSFSTAVISMNVLYLLLYTPWCVSFLLFSINEFLDHDFVKSNTENQSHRLTLITTLTDCIAFINNYSLFFICLLFNNLFREELATIFKKTFSKTINSQRISNKTVNIGENMKRTALKN